MKSQTQELERASQTVSRNSLISALISGIQEGKQSDRPLWKGTCAEFSLRGLLHFVFYYAYGYDPTDPETPTKPIPAHRYLCRVVKTWWEDRTRGEITGIKKSRRLAISWTVTACETWWLGMKQSTQIVACQDYEDSMEMVGRHLFIYRKVAEKNPEWKLGEPKAWHGTGPGLIRSLLFPNGSQVIPGTGRDPDTLRQKGASGIRLEEAAFFTKFAGCVANAKMMLQPPGGKTQGHLCVISTTNGENKEWLAWKVGEYGEA